MLEKIGEIKDRERYKDIKDIFNEKNTIHIFMQGLDKDYSVHVHMVMMRLGM